MLINVSDYGMNGEGVGKIDGKVILINNTLIGEEAEVEIVEDNKNYSIAKCKKIINKSENRQNPPCPYFYECGGCNLQHMIYTEQLNYKTILVKKTLKKVAGIDFSVSNCVACDEILNYRNKSSFNFKNNKCGFYKENSNDIVEIDSCIISSKNINKVYSLFKDFMLSTNNLQYVKNLVVKDINNQI